MTRGLGPNDDDKAISMMTRAVGPTNDDKEFFLKKVKNSEKKGAAGEFFFDDDKGWVRPMMTNDELTRGCPTNHDKEISMMTRGVPLKMTKNKIFGDDKEGVQNLCHQYIISGQPLTVQQNLDDNILR